MRIFAQCDSQGNILATAKVEIMAEELDKIWKKFLKNHWQMLALFIVIADSARN